MLERYHMQDSKPMDTLVNKSLSLSHDMCPKTLEEKDKISRIPYASAIGSLMYVGIGSRITYEGMTWSTNKDLIQVIKER